MLINIGIRGPGGTGPPNVCPRDFQYMQRTDRYILHHMHASCTWWLQILYMRQTSLLGFIKSTSSIGCVCTECNYNAGKPTRLCTSGIDYFDPEDGTSVESSSGEPICAATFVQVRPLPNWNCLLLTTAVIAQCCVHLLQNKNHNY